MDKNDIKTKALSKIQSNHYFDRYLNLIEAFVTKNKELSNKTYFEKHHILPKAKDMFPEYKCLKQNPWNGVKLTARQHFIAHWLLWKIFGGSQAYVFDCFATQSKNKNNKRQGLRINSRVYEKLKVCKSEYMKTKMRGKATYVDSQGNKIHCSTDDPRVLSGELVAQSRGRKYKPRTNEQKLNSKKSLLEHHRNKSKQPSVYLYKGVERIATFKYSEEYHDYLSKGWSVRCPPERISYNSSERNRKRQKVVWSEESRQRASEKSKGRKVTRSQIIKAALSRRGNKPLGDPAYEMWVYEIETDTFINIDRLLFDARVHIEVSKRVQGERTKIVNVETGEVLHANPALPRLPEKFVRACDYLFVTAMNINDKSFVKMRKYQLDENHIQIIAHNDNRVKITDNQGVRRFVPIEVKEKYFG